jgi:hypothetical protein
MNRNKINSKDEHNKHKGSQCVGGRTVLGMLISGYSIAINLSVFPLVSMKKFKFFFKEFLDYY